MRCANLPDTLSQHMMNCHLHLLAASEYWTVDKPAGVLRRTVRAPKSLMPHLHVIVDDLLPAYNTGTMRVVVVVRICYGIIPVLLLLCSIIPTTAKPYTGMIPVLLLFSGIISIN